ncbi:MAG: hypothetical protein ABI580_02570 [Burkholderiaceae bacterium]
MNERPELNLEEYYKRATEETRLERGRYVLEKARTQELIRRYLPRAPATVLDVGGVAEAYAFWLTHLGYDVQLVDLSPRLVKEAMRLNSGR